MRSLFLAYGGIAIVLHLWVEAFLLVDWILDLRCIEATTNWKVVTLFSLLAWPLVAMPLTSPTLGISLEIL